MAELTPEYIEQHLSKIQTAESFGRNIAEAALQSALAHVRSKGDTDVFEFTFTGTVKPVKAMGCIVAEICTPIGCFRYHFDV